MGYQFYHIIERCQTNATFDGRVGCRSAGRMVGAGGGGGGGGGGAHVRSGVIILPQK